MALHHLVSSSLLASLITGSALATQQFTVLDLGVLPGHTESRAWGLNDFGQVVGWSRSGSSLRAIVFDPQAGLSEVGLLPGMLNSAARDVNNAGEIVGSSWAATITQPGRPFLRDASGTLVDLGALPGGTTGEAFAVNDSGIVVGMAQGAGASPEPFRATTAGGLTALSPGAAGNAYDVNIAGLIAGEANGRAIVWDGNGSATPLAQDPSYPRSRAQAINGAGTSAGIQENASGTTARLSRWTDSGWEDLGILGRYSQVTGINDAGWIVGYDQFSFQVQARAFLYTPGAGRQFLDDLLAANPQGWTITSVFDVNAAGQMAANGVNSLGERRALLLDPTGGNGTPRTSILCSGVANSTGSAGTLGAVSIDVAAGTMDLVSSHLPPQAFGITLASLRTGFTAAPGGSLGQLCLGGPIGRAVGGSALQSSASGDWVEAVDLHRLPQPGGPVAVQAGDTWFFQAWYRDHSGGIVSSNLTDGLRVIF